MAGKVPKNPVSRTERMPSQEPMVDELDMSPRTTGSLLVAGILTARDLCSCSKSQLLEIDGLGKASLEEIEYTLAHYGKKLRTK